MTSSNDTKKPSKDQTWKNLKKEYLTKDERFNQTIQKIHGLINEQMKDRDSEIYKLFNDEDGNEK